MAGGYAFKDFWRQQSSNRRPTSYNMARLSGFESASVRIWRKFTAAIAVPDLFRNVYRFEVRAFIPRAPSDEQERIGIQSINRNRVLANTSIRCFN